jgi:hypothetical protein
MAGQTASAASRPRRSRRQWGWRSLALRALIIGVAASVAAVGAASASAATTTLANSKPDHVAASNGNLYWTSDSRAYVTQPSGLVSLAYMGAVWRASKSNVPGQEQLLASETESYPVDFESITWARVGGQYYAYFVTNYPSRGISRIKRVPLSGGTEKTLVTSPATIGSRNLVNDGSYLYWADAGGIRKMPIGGGRVTTLASGATFAHLGLGSAHVFYSSGARILTVAKSGGSPRPFVTAGSNIRALYVLAQGPNAFDDTVYWGEADGAVMSYPSVTGHPFQYQAPASGVSVTSVTLSDTSLVTLIMWGECTPTGCGVQLVDPIDGSEAGWLTRSAPIDVTMDDNGAYWGDNHLEKHTF